MEPEERPAPRQLGLALSGGGFRACLFHLGVVRFLRDARLLEHVSTITSVSGGSILSAHLALNWDRYCGSEEDFDDAAGEVIRVAKMDLRNRIVRRFPLGAGVNLLRRLVLLGPDRAITRTGLLERHYERFLYGDKGLFELPESPRVYILATNLSHGSLSAFCRDGLVLQHRQSSGGLEVEVLPAGLATVSMAVAASSAFPGFFPPLELSGRDIGLSEGEFGGGAFTDGGIYDNLGLRMFRFMKTLAATGSEAAPPEGLDAVVVSDAGASFKVTSGSAGGMLRTALRSSDILMNRVYQLEVEAFAETGGVTFIPITRTVTPEEDPSALHPEIQRHTAWVRTDLDGFRDLEIAALTQHGYQVAREIAREEFDLPASDIPDGPPWNALEGAVGTRARDAIKLDRPRDIMAAARSLQRGSGRRVVSNLLSLRDWPTYVWLPLLALLILGGPYLLYDARQTALRTQQVLAAVAQSSPLYADVLDELERAGPEPIGELDFAEVDSVEPLDFTGYDVISDDRIYDLRGWSSTSAPEHAARMHARFVFRRTEEAIDRPVLRIQLPSEESAMRAEYLPRSLNPQHVRAFADGLYTFETRLDYSAVPIGSETTVEVRQDMPEFMATQDPGMGSFRFTVAARTGLVRMWVLLPVDRPHADFELYRAPIGRPDSREVVHATTTVEVPNGAIATFEMVNPPEGYRYVVSWRWLGRESS